MDFAEAKESSILAEEQGSNRKNKVEVLSSSKWREGNRGGYCSLSFSMLLGHSLSSSVFLGLGHVAGSKSSRFKVLGFWV
jgi:hypothetical protein